jgi:hypothetical protein
MTAMTRVTAYSALATSSTTATGAVESPRRSRGIGSLLPWLLMTGVVTLVVTGILRITATGSAAGFLGSWMESWLTSWPIAFPVAYLTGPMLTRFADRVSAPTASPDGLGYGDIELASARVTTHYGLTVRRKRKESHQAAPQP